MTAVTIDASAMLAMLLAERGGDRVEAMLPNGLISTVNWSEVIQKALDIGSPTIGLADELIGAGLQIVDFELADADLAGGLWQITHHLGLSLADRACLATALRRSSVVITADRAWRKLDLDVKVEVIR
ncbi:MAG: type II toxin-antitoxin system VapC family toxin [Chloroflexota bacterium]|jgi:PIN domain nuclease of toxin-antitoxin system|nr:type II toxin-antitoxin system VapC family toxin [Chloroflexota bacterium]